MKISRSLVLGLTVLVGAFVFSFGSVSAYAGPPAPPTYTNSHFTLVLQSCPQNLLEQGWYEDCEFIITNTVSGSSAVTVNLSTVYGEAYANGTTYTGYNMDSYSSVNYSTEQVTVSYGSPVTAWATYNDNYYGSDTISGYDQIYGAAIVGGAPVAATANHLVRCDSN